eukprot:TRINITY_DN64242_c0_g1_i1.p1 TRINITY_DN64242_c0_g1~~TRINITY_DN64242_c0_g1_i1.p1  ORF type:complete len:109 (-),score=9.54 TRINITY_DN64242_c0_g1_i1:16-342(-)
MNSGCSCWTGFLEDLAGLVAFLSVGAPPSMPPIPMTFTAPAGRFFSSSAGGWLASCCADFGVPALFWPVSYTHLRAHETPEHLVCRLLLEKKNLHIFFHPLLIHLAYM